MRRKRINWLPIILIVIVGLYLKSAVMGTPRPVQQAPPVESSNNNTRAEAEPAPHVPQPTESHHSDPKQLYLKVVGVHDGDTITGLDEDKKQLKIRLDAIDAPELGMPFGQASRKALSEKVFGKQVEVIVKTKDRYGRTVGHVLLDKRDMNLEMLEEGMAWHYAHYDHNKRLAEAEKEARGDRVGLWSDPNPVAPWDWRASGRLKGPANKRGK